MIVSVLRIKQQLVEDPTRNLGKLVTAQFDKRSGVTNKK